jgi:hypothetical protein
MGVIMFRLKIIVLSCCCLIGCKAEINEKPQNFKERQEQLFYGIDHKLVYQSCQELMRLRREGKLSRTTYYVGAAEAGQNELPEIIRSLQPTYVHVYEIMVDITFHSDDHMQLLRCFSNEFGEHKPRDGDSKGLGFRKDPFEMDKLSGTESLDYLNENYDHFQMELVLGLTYEKYEDEESVSLEEMKKRNEAMDKMMNFMTETIQELAVKKQKLLYQTDHQELLKACRQVITRYNDGVYSRAKINIIDASANDLEQIPKIILDLEPVYIWIHKDRVMVALMGGMDHAGVTAYMNSEEAVASDDDFLLIDGLLYYDDGLREADDDYKDYLKDLKDEAIIYLDWKRKKMNLPVPKRME